MVKILIVDDHTLIREGLRVVLARDSDLQVIGEARDGTEAVQKALELRPDVILMDIKMPHSGLQATIDILQNLPKVGILMLTVSDDESDLIEAVKAGAKGYLLKDSGTDVLISAVKLVASGGAILTPSMASKILDEFRIITHKDRQALRAAKISGMPGAWTPTQTDLTIREMEILLLVAKGASNKEIAAKLSISLPTVKTHLRNILSKLHLKNRSQAAIYAASKEDFKNRQLTSASDKRQ